MIKLFLLLFTVIFSFQVFGFGNDQEFKPKNNLILNPGGQVDFSADADLQGNSILNAIFDSDLNTLTNIVNADVKSTAAIDRTKIASGAANYVLINNGSGVFSEEQYLDKTRGGTGITSTATFPASGTISVIDATEDLSNKTFTDSITLTEIASPGTPAASDKFFFCKSDDKCYFKNDAASEVEISTGVHTAAGITESVNTVSANYTVTDGDGYTTILVDDTSSDRTITLPTAADNTDRVLTIKNISTDKGNVIIDGEGGQFVEGMTTVDLDFKDGFIKIQCDGVEWFIISTNIGSELKQYDLTVTGTNYTSSDAVGVPSRTVDGDWRLRFNIRGAASPNIQNGIITVSGATFKSNGQQALTYSTSGNNSSVAEYAEANSGASTILFQASAGTAVIIISGDVELNAKPTFVE